MAIADASVLISLAKTGRLNALRRVLGRILVAPAVKSEVVDRGKEMGHPEVVHIEQAADDGWIAFAELSEEERTEASRLASITHLGAGEAQSLATALTRHDVLVVDEKEARAVAVALGVTHLGSAAVLLDDFMKGNIGLEDLEEAVVDLARMSRLSPDVIARIMRSAREVER